MRYKAKVLEIEPGETFELPPAAETFTVMSEPTDDGKIQVTCLIDAPDARGVA